MAKAAGAFSQIFFHGYDLTGRSNQYSMDIEYNEEDLTAFGDEGENSQPGLPSPKGELTSFMDPVLHASHDALKTAGVMTDKILSVLIGATAAPVIGDPAISLLCKQFKYSPRHELKSAVLAGASFKSAGQPADLGIALANATITNTTNFTGVDNGAASLNGGAGYLHVMTPAAADTYSIKIQHSVDGNVWVDLLTFAANGSARTSEQQVAAEGTTVNQYLRAQATRTGAAANPVKLCITFGRR